MRLSLVVFIFLLSTHANAGFFADTQSLLDACEDQPTFCRGYMAGFDDVWENWRRNAKMVIGEVPPPQCVPDGVKDSQLVKVHAKYMEEHPEQLHLPPTSTVIWAFIDAFDCATE